MNITKVYFSEDVKIAKNLKKLTTAVHEKIVKLNNISYGECDL